MRAFTTVTAVLTLVTGFAAATKKCVDSSLVAHDGTPVGFEKEYDGVNLYISKPKHHHHNTSTAVLYLTDVFGIQLPQNKLLADSFARAGYLTVAPDMFNGTPAPGDINNPGGAPFNVTEFLAKHAPNATDPIIASTISTLKSHFGVEKIAIAGYCFGGRYVFRFLADGKGGDVGFTAHPSLLGNDEIMGSVGPASIAFAETDSMLIPSRRVEVQSLLQNSTLPYSVALYGGTSHGFGVRANVSDPKQKFAKEEAFVQAVHFFDYWL